MIPYDDVTDIINRGVIISVVEAPKPNTDNITCSLYNEYIIKVRVPIKQVLDLDDTLR